MKKNSLKIDRSSVQTKLHKFTPLISRHAPFAAVMLVLIVYLFTVWRISSLSSAEPSDADISSATTSANIPKINKASIDQIQSLEQNNVQLQSIFNQARNNPFQE